MDRTGQRAIAFAGIVYHHQLRVWYPRVIDSREWRNLTSSLYRLTTLDVGWLKCKSTPELTFSLPPSLPPPSLSLSLSLSPSLPVILAPSFSFPATAVLRSHWCTLSSISSHVSRALLALTTSICQLFRRYRNNLTKFSSPLDSLLHPLRVRVL